jgi:DNA helicase-2/ATP-dependent DNA helicase PcrA
MHGLWQANMPSRFLDELPEEHVEVKEAAGGFGGFGGYGASRFDEETAFGSSYGTPGWQRAQRRAGARETSGFDEVDDFEAAVRQMNADAARSTRPAAGNGSGKGGLRRGPDRRSFPVLIEGELVAKSTGAVSAFAVGARVFHQKFGYGNVAAADGNKLTIQFDKAGQKRVVDTFVERA